MNRVLWSATLAKASINTTLAYPDETTIAFCATFHVLVASKALNLEFLLFASPPSFLHFFLNQVVYPSPIAMEMCVWLLITRHQS